MIVGSRRKQRGALRTHDSAGEAPPARACAAQPPPAARAISLERRCASAVSRRWDLIVSFSNVEDELERYGFTPASTRRRSSPT